MTRYHGRLCYWKYKKNKFCAIIAVHIYIRISVYFQFTMGNFYRMAHALFPVPPEELTQMCRQGFDDTLKFLQRNGMIQITA